VRQRLDGVTRAVREAAGAVSLTTLHTAELRVEDGRRVGHELVAMGEHERPDGVVAAADLVALGIVQAVLAETGLRFPDDLGMVGFDNNRTAWESVVPLSTLAQPGEEMGRVATRLLLEEIGAAREERRHEHRQVVLQPQLLVRASSVRAG
jgi:LacI family transcriptional regulator